MSPAMPSVSMPQWVLAIVSLIERMVIWFSDHLFQPSVRETNELIQQPGEVEQVAQASKKGKRQRNRDKKRSGQSQSKIKELEQQPVEMKLNQQEELVPPQEAKEEPMEKPGGEDQRGLSAIHTSKPVATDGEQPRIQFGTLGMEIEVPSSESEELLLAAGRKLNNSEDENKTVEEGLNKPYPFFSVPLADLSGVVAEGRQPLSNANSTQIDKEINKVPTGIVFARALKLRQLVSDAAEPIKQFDTEIGPNLDEAALSGGRLSKYSFSTKLRALLVIELERPTNSDIDNRKWLKKYHLSNFKEENGRDWLKENLQPRKAEERLNILEKAATACLGDAGRELVLLFKLNVQTNRQVHPKLDLDKVILDSKKGMYTYDGEDLGEVVQLLAEKLKKQSTE